MASSLGQGFSVSWGSALGKRSRGLSNDSDVFEPASGASEEDDTTAEGLFVRSAKRHHVGGRLGQLLPGVDDAMQMSDTDMASPEQITRVQDRATIRSWAEAEEARTQMQEQLASEDSMSRDPRADGSSEPQSLIRPRSFAPWVDTPLIKSRARHAPTSPSPLSAHRPHQLTSLKARQRSLLSQGSLEMMEEDATATAASRFLSITDSPELSPPRSISGSVTPMSTSSSSPWQSRDSSPTATRQRQRSAAPSGDAAMDLSSPMRTPTKGRDAVTTPPLAVPGRQHHSPGLERNATPPGGRQMLRYTMGYREDCELCRLKTPGHYSHVVHRRPGTNA